jgi:FkbM family methyltransferase
VPKPKADAGWSPRPWLGLMWGLARAAPSPGAGLWNAAMFAIMPLLQPMLKRSGRHLPIRVGLGGSGYELYVDSVGDLKAVYEVWALRTYDVPALQRAEVILDAGANVGASVAFFKARRPLARVHAYEPDPATFGKLARNVGWLPGVVLHQQALGGVDGEAALYSSAQGWDSSLVARRGDPVRVSCRRLATARQEAGLQRVDLVKIDIEGAEFADVRSPGALEEANAIVMELHFDLAPDAVLREVLEACAGFRVTVTGDSTYRMMLMGEREQTAVEESERTDTRG